VRAELAALDLRRVSRRRARRAVSAVADEFAKHDLLTYSSAISFQVLYAVVPLAFLVLALIGLVGAESLYTHHIAPTLRRDLSPQAFTIANRTARRVLGAERPFWLTLGLVVTLWGVGAALRSMMTPLNRVYGAKEHRSWLRRLAVSIAAGAGISALLLAAVGAVLLGRLAHPHGVLVVAVFLARWLAALLLLLGGVALLIRAVPAKKRPLEWVTVGSILCVVCWILATIGYGAYISVVSYTTFYGAVAAIVLLLVYLHVSAIAFLLGVVVDALLRETVEAS